jgi:uncharacterized protein (DUF1501 family)
MPFHMQSRRTFLKQTAAASAGLLLAGSAPAFSLPRTGPIRMKPQDKALVFIMLDGGNDSYNMLVPMTGDDAKVYRETRSNLALGEGELLPLEGYRDQRNRQFGIHNAMPEVQKLFTDKKLSFVANVGPLIEPVTKESFYKGARLPLGLLSHADQFKHWQTSRPDQRQNQGWFGNFGDSLSKGRPLTDIPMNISLAGNNIQQNGFETSPYAITEEGSVGLYVNETQSELNSAILESFENLLHQDYNNDPFKATYLSQTRIAQAQHQTFKDATGPIKAPTPFSDSQLSQELRQVAETIKASQMLGLRQQTFFLRYIGWDHHDELLDSHSRMLGVLSRALGEFQQALEAMDLEDKVITFTGSDFGRTLTSNGNGTDHGWGGNTIVMGGDVEGGRIFGDYPILALGSDNALDVGDGVLIPTLATDQLYADLALWFGLDSQDLPRLFPNLANFSSTKVGASGLGLIAK